MNGTVMTKNKYKETEVGLIPDDWEIKNLVKDSTLKARIGWQGLTTSEYLNTGEYYLVTGTDFSNGRIQWDTCHYVEKMRYDQDENIQLKQNDILITKDGTIGKIAFIDNLPKEATLNSGVFVVRPKDGAYSPLYFSYVLNSAYFDTFLKKLKAGSTISHLYQKDCVYFDFPVPKASKEQEAIAEVLSDIDVLIKKIQTLIDKKTNVKKGTMQKLFECKEDLNFQKLGSICKVKRGASPRPIEDPKWWGNISGWVRISDVTATNKYLTKTQDYLSEEGVKNSVRISKGELIVSICATIGKPIIVKMDACIHDGFVWFDGLSSMIDREFLYYYFQNYADKIASNRQVGTQGNLNTSIISELELPILDTREQQRIAQILSDMDLELEKLEQKLEKYKALKIGMMQELLTGKTRLPINQTKAKSQIISVDFKERKQTQNKSKGHNEQFDEAVVISMLTYKFSNPPKYPFLGSFRRQKFNYLFKRFLSKSLKGIDKKAMGPYKSETRYKGPEGIAIKNGYVKNSKKYTRAFMVGDNINEAINYFTNYYGSESIDWLEQFRFAKDTQLETLTTVDLAKIELEEKNLIVNVENVKKIIAENEEWKPKLEKPHFSDAEIQKAINWSKELFK